MTIGDLQQYLRAAGWPENLIVTMAAIGMAESKGNPRAHNPVPPDDSYGLWQINMLGRLGPERRARFGIASNDALYDPLVNAKAAFSIYRQQGLRAWSTYTNGAYQRFIPQSQAAYQPGASQTIPISNGDTTANVVEHNDSLVDTGNATTKLLIGAGALLLFLYATQ